MQAESVNVASKTPTRGPTIGADHAQLALPLTRPWTGLSHAAGPNPALHLRSRAGPSGAQRAPPARQPRRARPSRTSASTAARPAPKPTARSGICRSIGCAHDGRQSRGSRQSAVGSRALPIAYCPLPYCLLRSQQASANPMELWLVDLEAAAPALEALERDVPRLSADDRDRAGRLSDARERRHRLAAYMALRVVLERLGGAECVASGSSAPPGGKPACARRARPSACRIPAGLALIGVRQIASHRRRSRGDPHSRHVAAPPGGDPGRRGGACGRPAGDADSDAAVLQAWCRLEACAKARGQGVARLLGELGLREARGRQLALAAIEDAARRLVREAGLAVDDVKLPPGLHGAVAYAGSGAAPRLRHFPTDRAAIARLLTPARAGRVGNLQLRLWRTGAAELALLQPVPSPRKDGQREKVSTPGREARRDPVRPHRRGCRQHRHARARQHARPRPAAGDPVLRHGPRADARSLPDDRRRQHVDERRPQPVPPAHRQGAGAARPHGPGDAEPRGAGAPAGRGEEAARRHALLLQGAQRVRRGDLPVGQPRALLRARRALRPHAARHALCGARRCRRGTADGIARFYREILRDRRRMWARTRRDGSPAPRSAPASSSSSARRTRPRRRSTATTSPSTSPTSPGPIGACSRAASSPRRATSTSTASRTSSISTAARCCSQIEHEVRSMRHPLYARPLVNRNPEQTNRRFAPGHEQVSWSLPLDG